MGSRYASPVLPRSRLARVGRHAAALALASGLGSGFVACGDASGDCPAATEPLSDLYQDVYRQLEICASRVTGEALHRDSLPRVESDPELVACNLHPDQTCVETAAGQTVYGFYLEGCDTFTVALEEVLLHEMLHPILCDVPPGDCDPGHDNPVWRECQSFKGCPEGRIILIERVCDGTPDCAEGEDELGCP